MAIDLINNGELGSSVRGKLNSNITRGNITHGWSTSVDNQYTSVSPFVVNSGTTVELPNNKFSSITTYLPNNSLGMYDGTRLIGDAVGDEYMCRINFEAFSSSNAGAFNILLDISALGDGSNIIATYPIQMLKGAGAANVQGYTISVDYFTLNTFVANGGLLKIESVTGNISIYDITYYIRKLSSGEI